MGDLKLLKDRMTEKIIKNYLADINLQRIFCMQKWF